MSIFSLKIFNHTRGKDTGGVTGSRRVALTDNPSKFYQLKPSIQENPSLIRKIKVLNKDRENISEVVAATIAKAFGLNSPNVDYVYDEDASRFLIASEYLQGDCVETLNDYAKKNGAVLPPEHKHIKFMDKPQHQHEVNISAPPFNALKKTLAEQISLAAVLGDHDVNPDNMIVATQGSQSKVVKIDFGHAFNDLLRAPSVIGGRLKNTLNPIKDFLNRENVAGLNAQSKLRRDYPDLANSPEMAEALIKIGQTSPKLIKAQVAEAKKDIKELIVKMGHNKDSAGQEHVLNSLIAMYKNFGDKPLEGNVNDKINQIFSAIENFVLSNCENALKIGQQLSVQVAVEQQMASCMEQGKPIPFNLEQQVTEGFPHDFFSQPMEWIRGANETKPFFGTLGELIIHKKLQIALTKIPEKIEVKLAHAMVGALERYKAQVTNEAGLEKAKLMHKYYYPIINCLINGNMGKAHTLNQEYLKLVEKNYGNSPSSRIFKEAKQLNEVFQQIMNTRTATLNGSFLMQSNKT